jgi:hypothetical protein
MNSDILKTWGQIAAYLQCTVQTAMRMSKRHDDFPIFHDTNVWTTRTLLEAWLTKRATAIKGHKSCRKK